MFVEEPGPSTHIRSRFPLHPSLSAVDGASIEGEGEKLNAEAKGIINADERTRTSTRLLPQRPERCASTNSATSAPEVGILLAGVEAVKQPSFSDFSAHRHNRRKMMMWNALMYLNGVRPMAQSPQGRNAFHAVALWRSQLSKNILARSGKKIRSYFAEMRQTGRTNFIPC